MTQTCHTSSQVSFCCSSITCAFAAIWALQIESSQNVSSRACGMHRQTCLELCNPNISKHTQSKHKQQFCISVQASTASPCMSGMCSQAACAEHLCMGTTSVACTSTNANSNQTGLLGQVCSTSANGQTTCPWLCMRRQSGIHLKLCRSLDDVLCRHVLFLSPARSDELEKWTAGGGRTQMPPL